MELTAWAREVVTSPELARKLQPPPAGLSDKADCAPERLEGPGRPPSLTIGKAGRAPAASAMADPRLKRKLLHSFWNHELQAVELFAWALVAFTEAPAAFRQGLLEILREEQSHVRLYGNRLRELGGEPGEFPVNGYFWGKAAAIDSPAAFVCAMGLTFENANLDHTLHYAAAAEAAGDARTARIITQIHRDEIRHVRFGWAWLERFKAPEQSMLEAYREHIRWPLRPSLARGREFDVASRRTAGLDDDFIAALEAADDPRSDTPPDDPR